MRAADPVIPFWFAFERTREIAALGLTLGCGVSGYCVDDALWIVQTVVFKDEKMPQPLLVIENIKMDDLDQNHIIQNTYPTAWRGIRYPMLGSPGLNAEVRK